MDEYRIECTLLKKNIAGPPGLCIGRSVSVSIETTQFLIYKRRDGARDQQGGSVNQDTSESIEIYKDCARDLEKYIADARKCKDQPAVDRLLSDLNSVNDQMKRLKGKDGKPRQLGGNEADRAAVQCSIKTVIDKCKTGWAMPRLSKHLADKIKCGSDVCYQAGEDSPNWVFF